jgi:aspartyl-tRNA(Asn)/glutamyl-tRNA(Gln) amidotransferase subunit A
VGKNVSARDYIVTLAKREEHKREFAAALAYVDALLTPTVQTAAIPLEKVDQGGTAAHFTRAGNYLGLCGLALPNGFTAEGMPTSLMINGHAGDEAMVLRIGWAYDQAAGFTSKRPPEP